MAEDPKSVDTKLALAAIMATVTIIAAIIVLVTHCSSGPTKTVQTPAPATPPSSDPVCADGSPSGAERDVACPAGDTGKDHQVCAQGKWQDDGNTCAAPTPPPGPGPGPSACGKVEYDTVAPLIQQYCVSCHGGWSTYAGVQPEAAAVARRIVLPAADTQHMPQRGAPQLCASTDDTKPTDCDKTRLIVQWVSDGAIDDCPNTPPPGPVTGGTVTEPQVVGAASADATKLNSTDRPFIRYVTMAAAMNEGATAAQIQTWVDALQKGLNSLNATTQDLKPATLVDRATGLYRFDARDYGLSVADLQTIENADVQINIVDQTSQAQVLEALLNARKPIWDPQVLLDTAFRNGVVYNKLLRIPANITQLEKNIGVNLANDLATLPTGQVSFITNVGQITLQKPRLILADVQARSTAAYYLRTFDVLNQQNIKNVIENGQIVQIDERNAFVAPLLAGTGAQTGQGIAAVATLTADASECIWQLPNGLQGYCLADGKGAILTAANPDIVQDNQAQIAPEGKNQHVITTGNTCSRCHNTGGIPMADAIATQVAQNGDQYDANDVQLILGVYRSASDNNKLFAAVSASFTKALGQLGVKSGPDPQALLSDHYLGNWSAKQLAAFLWITPDQLSTCINGNAQVKAALGTILAGTQVAFAQVEGNTLKSLIATCHLFQDPIAQ